MSQTKSRSDANPGLAKPASLSRAVSLHMEGKLKEALDEINRVLEAGDETPELFSAATRGRIKGRPKGKDLLSGKVRCGMCQRLMALDQNGEGRKMYRCKHRGQGCAQPRRTNVGLLRAAVLGLQLIGDDEQLQDAIRRELERARQPAPKAGGGTARRSRNVVGDLEGQRRKLLRLYYDDRIGADLFAEEEARLAGAIKAAQCEHETSEADYIDWSWRSFGPAR